MTDKDSLYSNLLSSLIDKYGKETRFLEFKSNYQEANKLGEYISALANGACLDGEDYGYLFFGVDDESLEVVGTKFDVSKCKFKGNQALEFGLRQYLSPKIDFQIEEFFYNGEQRVVVFVIPAATGEPVCFNNEPFVRIDSHVTKLKAYTDWLRTIYNSHHDWSKEIVEGASVEDLDTVAVEKAKKGYKERFPEHSIEVDGWDTLTFLDHAKLTIGGKITRTTLLLLGKEESVHFLNHPAQIVWRLNASETAADIFSIPFLLSTDKLLNRIRNYRFKIFPKNSLIPAEVWKYDTQTILEALHNCIAHQDYWMNNRIVVTETDESLTFENAGKFYDGTFEDYVDGNKTPKRYRNHFLSQAMVNLKMIDTQGFGIHHIFKSQKERYLPMPDYVQDNPDYVKLRIPGVVIDEGYSLLLMERSDITLSTAVLLDKVQKNKPITSEARKFLRSQKLIEGKYHHIYISKSLAHATGQEVEYSLSKGMSDRYYKDYLLSSIADHHQMTRSQINQLMLKILPGSDEKSKLSKIGNMLTALRKKGFIRPEGKKCWIYICGAPER